MEIARRMVETVGEAKHNVPSVTLNLSEVRLSVWDPVNSTIHL
jgi:hypothetical protein